MSDVGKLGPRAHKSPLLLTEFGRSVLLSIPGHYGPGSAMSKASGWDYDLDSAGLDSVCQDLHASFCKPLPTSLPQSESQGLSPADSPAITVGQGQSRGSYKAAHDAGRGLVPPGLFFASGQTRGSGETSPYGQRCPGGYLSM